MKSLTKKLVKVMAAVGNIEKNGRNDFHKYDYVKESDVMDAIRPHLVAQGLFITSSVASFGRDNDIMTVVMEHTIHDMDSDESLTVKSVGVGQDKGDKAANKAVTAATKYFILKNFMLSTGKDDPEASDENGKSTGPKTKPTIVAATAPQSATPAKPTYGFSARAKVGATAVSAKVEPEVSTDDSF